jgi:hypothetical protein
VRLNVNGMKLDTSHAGYYLMDVVHVERDDEHGRPETI